VCATDDTSRTRNLTCIANAIRHASRRKRGRSIELWVLPELATCGYPTYHEGQLRRPVGEPLHGPSATFFEELCLRHGTSIAWSFAHAEKSTTPPTIAAAFSWPTSSTEAKTDILAEKSVRAGDLERTCFDAGARPWGLVDAGILQVGAAICADLEEPEVRQDVAKEGPNLVLHLASATLNWHKTTLPAWAKEKGLYCVTANRSGTWLDDHGEERTFLGESQVVGPSGAGVRLTPTADAILDFADGQPEKRREDTHPVTCPAGDAAVLRVRLMFSGDAGGPFRAEGPPIVIAPRSARRAVTPR
jgi:predicted amidohydrolase